MRYLQTEWQRNERDRIQWELERAEMKTRIAKLEGEKRGLQLLVENHVKRIKILEASQNGDLLEESKTEFDKQIEESKDVDLSPLIESRQYLEKCIQEVEYLLQSTSTSNGNGNGNGNSGLMHEQVVQENERPREQEQEQEQMDKNSSKNDMLVLPSSQSASSNYEQSLLSRDLLRQPSRTKFQWKFKNTFHFKSVNSIKILSQKQLIAGGDQGIRMWDLEEGTHRDLSKEPRNAKLLLNSSRDVVFTTGQSGTFGYRIETESEGTDKKVFESGYSSDIAINADMLATIENDNDNNSTIKLWDVKTNEELKQFSEQQNAKKVSLFNGSKLLVVYLNKISIIDIETGKSTVEFATTKQVNDVCFSLPADLIIVGNDDGTIHHHDARMGANVAELSSAGVSSPITCLSASPTSRHFVSGSMDGMLKVWSIGQSEPVETHKHQHAILGCEWYSSDMMASCGDNVVQTYSRE